MIKQGETDVNYIVDSDSEVANVPVGEIGATIYVVNEQKVYMSNGTSWVEQ